MVHCSAGVGSQIRRAGGLPRGNDRSRLDIISGRFIGLSTVRLQSKMIYHGAFSSAMPRDYDRSGGMILDYCRVGMLIVDGCNEYHYSVAI